MMKNIKEENRNNLHFVPFVVGRIYKANDIKVVCTKRTKCYAEFDFYFPWNDTSIPDVHEKSTIYVSKNGMFEYVIPSLYTKFSSTECVEFAEQLNNILETVKKQLADAEIIDVADDGTAWLTNRYYYKIQRTQYSKPVYFVINDTEITLVNNEEFEKIDKKTEVEDIGELVNKITNFITENKCKYGLI